MSVFINDGQVDGFKFSGGEIHVKIEPSQVKDTVQLRAHLKCSDDVMALLLTVDAVRRINPDVKIHLEIPYFPYARQDRVCNIGEAFSLKVMANLINGLHCNKVEIYDPHSEVTPALLDRCVVHSLASLVKNSALAKIIVEKDLVLVSPDAGAEKKIRELAKSLSTETTDIRMISARKVRDTRTGEIVSTEVNGDIKGRDLIIVDDICDGGQTFIELAKALKSQGARELYLYVTHGIFSKGLDRLKEYFTTVYCYYPFHPNGNDPQPFLVNLTSLN